MIRRRLTTTTYSLTSAAASRTQRPVVVVTTTSSCKQQELYHNHQAHHRQQQQQQQQKGARLYSSWIHPSILQPVQVPREAYPSTTSTTPTNLHERLIVIGSGVAGSATALIAAELYRIPVTLLYAGTIPTDCNSNWAQGGIIYRNYNPKSNDSAELLASDIHRAGAGLCYDPAVQKVAHEGPDRVRQLLLDTSINNIFANVPFDRTKDDSNELALCLEASHGAPRILHKADHSGQVITQHITDAVKRHPLITLQPQTIVTDVIVQDGLCIGVETIQQQQQNDISIQKREYASYGTVLATGGLAGIYEHTTNPSGFNALGSSVAIARRANVQTQDLEYVQFHPTALCIPNQSRFLLTEALRGEGAILRDANGTAFAKQYHPDGELAPRDVVARAVFAESQKVKNNDSNDEQQQHNVFLDITHRNADWIHQRFPTICEYLRTNTKYDLAYDMLPIIPAAHYTCGGVTTDLNGCTNIPGLYAAGEAARTGLHGGNRLASTSLLEGLVFGAAVADHIGLPSNENHIQTKEASQMITNLLKTTNNTDITSSSISNRTTASTNVIHETKQHAKQLLQQLKRIMWDYVGVTRTTSGLRTAISMISDIQEQADELYHHSTNTKCPEIVAVRDASYAGYGVALAAQSNRRSVGAHCIVLDDHHHHNQQQQQQDDVESDDDESELLTATH